MPLPHYYPYALGLIYQQRRWPVASDRRGNLSQRDVPSVPSLRSKAHATHRQRTYHLFMKVDCTWRSALSSQQNRHPGISHHHDAQGQRASTIEPRERCTWQDLEFQHTHAPMPLTLRHTVKKKERSKQKRQRTSWAAQLLGKLSMRPARSP